MVNKYGIPVTSTFLDFFFGSVFPLHSAQYKIHTYIGLYIRGDYGQPIRSDPRQSQNEN